MLGVLSLVRASGPRTRSEARRYGTGSIQWRFNPTQRWTLAKDIFASCATSRDLPPMRAGCGATVQGRIPRNARVTAKNSRAITLGFSEYRRRSCVL